MASALMAALLRLAPTRWRQALSGDRGLHLLGAWSVAAFVYAGAYFTWNLWPF